MSLKGWRGRRGPSGRKANLESQSILITHGRTGRSLRHVSQEAEEGYSGNCARATYALIVGTGINRIKKNQNNRKISFSYW